MNKAKFTISKVGEMNILKKYKVYFLVASYLELNRLDGRFSAHVEYGIPMEEFRNHFPKVAQLLLYQKLFGGEEKIGNEEFNSFLPSSSKWRFHAPTLKVLLDYVVFENISQILWRKEWAGFLHAIEALEKSLQTTTFEIEKQEEKEK